MLDVAVVPRSEESGLSLLFGHAPDVLNEHQEALILNPSYRNRKVNGRSLYQMVLDLENENLAYVEERLAREHGLTPDEIKDAKTAFIQFIVAVTVNTTNQNIAPCKAADLFWHTFLMFTRSYAAFCMKHVGRFIHHEPSESHLEALYGGTRAFISAIFEETELTNKLWNDECAICQGVPDPPGG